MPSVIQPRDLADYIEHTLLGPAATSKDVRKLCAEALEHRFRAVCVSGSRVLEAYALLAESTVKVVTVVGFPLGNEDSDTKRYETEVAVDNGAAEIDVVLNVGRLKDGDHAYVLRELRDVVDAVDGRPVKVIIETCLLSRDEKILACQLVLDSGAQFVKTSTGFGVSNGTIEDVQLLRETVGEKFGIKAAGGIRDAKTAIAMIEAGANRLGSSVGVKIVSSFEEAQVHEP